MCKTMHANKNKTNLGQRESSVAEHADLVCDVVPSDALLLLALLQLLAQQQAHVPDAKEGGEMNEMRACNARLDTQRSAESPIQQARKKDHNTNK